MLIISLQILTLLGLAALYFLKPFLPAYVAKKGENLATKEDIAEITAKIEQVKASLGSRQHIHQVRYEREFAIMLELTEKLVELRDAATSFRPEVSYSDASHGPRNIIRRVRAS